MRGRALLPLLAMASFCSLPGCGKGEGLSFATRELSAETHRLLLYYFEPNATCAALWMSSDRSAALHGPFASEPLDEDDRAEGFEFESRELPSGSYVVVVDALDAADTLIGSGCAEGQQVLEQRSSFTEIVIYPVE